MLCFIDSLYGWYIAQNDTIYKTTNGGYTWSSIRVNPTYFSSMKGIYFTNSTTGWLAGFSSNNNKIAKTTNGGLNWTVISDSLNFIPAQIYMLNDVKGFIIPAVYPWYKIGVT